MEMAVPSGSLNYITSDEEQGDPFEKSRMLFWADPLENIHHLGCTI